MRVWVILAVSFIIWGLNPNFAQSSTLYVALSGDNTNDGIANPFRTIKYACSRLATGDSLIIQDGDYGQELDIVLSVNGQEGDPVVVMAANNGQVFLHGTRLENELDGGGDCFIIRGSYIRLEGLSFTDFSVAVWVDGDSEGNVHHHEFVQCEFVTNGEVGLQNVRNDYVLVSGCRFIDHYSPDPEGVLSIQDYGINFYWNSHILVEECYFFGNHHQGISFKKGNSDGLVKKCIFEGARYTAIFFGQDYDPEQLCYDLTADSNIVRPAVGHAVKTPINVANVQNATVSNNYFEGFDGAPETGRSGGIIVWDISRGIQRVYGNVLAYSNLRPGLIIEESSADSVLVYNNTMHSLDTDAYVYLSEHLNVVNNLSSECSGSHLVDYGHCFAGVASFVGPVVQAPLGNEPRYLDHAVYYEQLVARFSLSSTSPCIDTGLDLGLLPFVGSAPDMGALEYDPTVSVLPQAGHTYSVINYPNPFNPSTQIQFKLDEPAFVRLDIFDVRGQLIGTVANGMKPEGLQSVTWDGLKGDGQSASSGVYFYKVSFSDKFFVGKMMLVK